MQEFNELIEVIDRLLGPNGCPWDKEQTLHSSRGPLLEETCEVIEAINLNNNEKMKEELGDLFFNVAFMGRLAEKEQRFNMKDVLLNINAKLIRRHPHIFGENSHIETSDQVIKQWEELKKQEKEKSSVIDDIPHELPALARAQKVYKRIKKTNYSFPECVENPLLSEINFGSTIFELIKQGVAKGFDPEQSLRAFLANLESQFRDWEAQNH